MPLLEVSDTHVILGDKLKLWVYSVLSDDVKEIEFEKPSVKSGSGDKRDDGHEEHQEPGSKIPEEHSVTIGSFSDDYRLFGVSDSYKRIFLLYTHDWSIKREFITERKLIKMCFNKNSSNLLCADRTGDVYSYDLTDVSVKNGKLLMGHLSILLDFKLTTDEKFIITSDRDEKIRVSKYPNCYNIECYCLDHTEFVSCVILWGDDRIISGSGDGTIRIWNFKTGKCLNKLEFPSSPGEKKPAVKELIQINDLQVVAYFYAPTVMSVIRVDQNDTLKMNGTISFHFPVITCRLLWQGLLLVMSQNFDKPFRLLNDQFQDTKDSKLLLLLQRLSENQSVIDSLFKMSNDDDLELLYKQWFNNVDQYLERKQKRIESKTRGSKKSKNDTSESCTETTSN